MTRHVPVVKEALNMFVEWGNTACMAGAWIESTS